MCLSKFQTEPYCLVNDISYAKFYQVDVYIIWILKNLTDEYIFGLNVWEHFDSKDEEIK